MNNYRNSKLIERYEDVFFELETALNVNPAGGTSQKKGNHRFVVDNTGESTPFDWYHVRFNVNITLEEMANGNAIAADDGMGIVNSASALIKKLNVKMNGIDVYDCSDANQATNIKNLLEYSQGYSKSQATNEFFYIDTTRSAEDRVAQAADYNMNFVVRKSLLNGNRVVNAEIPLNRYGFFSGLYDELLPTGRIELKIDLESDNNIAWRRAGNDCRVILTKFQLIVPRIVFNADGQSLYISKYLNTRKWTYLRELVERGYSTQQQSANFRISTAINKPRHVFVFILNDANLETQTVHKFIYNTFSISTNPRTLQSCYLEVGNGKEYPEIHFKPSEEPTRVFCVGSYIYLL